MFAAAFDGAHFQLPPYAQPAIAASAVVVERQFWLHAMAAGGDFDGDVVAEATGKQAGGWRYVTGSVAGDGQ